MDELYINSERMKRSSEKPKANLEFWKVLVPIIVTFITVFGSLVGIFLQGSKSATKIEYIVSQINDAIIPRLEKALESTSTEIKMLRERIAILEKMNEVHRAKITPTVFGAGLNNSPLELPAPAVKSLSKPAADVLKRTSKYDFPRLRQERPE